MTCARAILIRPGALGDVLVAMPVIRFLKDCLHRQTVTLLAPSSRGKFLRRDGWADDWHDLDSAVFSPLHQPPGSPVPPALAKIFADATHIVSLAGVGDSERDAAFISRLRELSPAAAIYAGQAAPPRSDRPAYQSLYEAVRDYFSYSPDAAAEEACINARIALPPLGDLVIPTPYLVIHPGSGSRKKNWPLSNYIALGQALMAKKGSDGLGLFKRLVVTSGEADGTAGDDLVDAIPGAIHLAHQPLEHVAAVLAGADAYIGNDSGISHLAASVESSSGARPQIFAIFGLTSSTVWGPRGAHILEAGSDFACLSPAAFPSVSPQKF